MAQQLSQFKFETGLILPGSERLIEAPLTPQGGSEQLIVRYATIDGSKAFSPRIGGSGANGHEDSGQGAASTSATDAWKSSILFRSPARRDSMREEFAMPAPGHPPPQADAEPVCLVTSTMKADSRALPIVETKATVTLPAVSGASSRLTGGRTAAEAARKAGLSQSTGLRAVYIDELSAWFMVARNGEASALRRKGDRWERVPMPTMDPIVPERFGKTTYILLNPAVFGDLVKVVKPSVHMYYDAGGNRLGDSQLRSILKRARERRVRLRLVTYDPNGLGVDSAISAGVTVGPGGQWINPSIKPSVRN
jgi:hypothetical protein